ncbi:SDR family NAD(P)-dependent oxidoreductase [Actinokineospora guangxiensis]|uniref:SDR family NAD(P)-dependent oxidoreductase n=1 Tax=Actinokineospora guangxiensis TaxID=1490288 RepID=A0ABW0EUK5_9PSEU
MGLHGKAVVVTGAGTGIGAATAIAVAARGASVALVGRRRDALEDTAAAARDRGARQVVVIAADLAVDADVERVAEIALAELDGVDGLVNNAGVGRFAPLREADVADLRYMFDLHVTAPAQLIQAFLPSLVRRRGSVVNVTSVAGSLAAPERSFYGATKAAANHLTRSLAKELAPAVRVNAVVPGPVDTPIYDQLPLSADGLADFRAALVAATPAGRFGTPEEVAPWICALLDTSAAWMTGVLLPVDGGRCA